VIATSTIAMAVPVGALSTLAVLLLCIAGVVMWSLDHSPDNAPGKAGDRPLRLLQWAVVLLPADQESWGEAMLGELASIDDQSKRWRFCLGCVVGILFQPPWTPIGPTAVLGAAALGSLVVLGAGFIHFGLASNPWEWVQLAVLIILVVGTAATARISLRRPTVTGLGLVDGVVVVIMCVAYSHLTFVGIVNPINSMGDWSNPALFIGIPLILGAVSAWRGGNALVGQRAARLAGASSGLIMFFIGTISVVAIDGGPRNPGAGIAGGVSEAFSNVAMFFLISIPLSMATIGWVGAAATDRIRRAVVAHKQLVPLGPEGVTGGVSEGVRSRSTAVLTLRVGSAIAMLAALALIVFLRF